MSSGRRAGRLFAVVEGDVTAFGGMGDHESAAADISRCGIDDGQRQLGSDGGVKGITALPENGQSRVAGQRMGGDDSAVCGYGRFPDTVMVWIGLRLCA